MELRIVFFYKFCLQLCDCSSCTLQLYRIFLHPRAVTPYFSFVLQHSTLQNMLHALKKMNCAINGRKLDTEKNQCSTSTARQVCDVTGLSINKYDASIPDKPLCIIILLLILPTRVTPLSWFLVQDLISLYCLRKYTRRTFQMNHLLHLLWNIYVS